MQAKKIVVSKPMRWLLGLGILLVVVVLPLVRVRWVYVETRRLREVAPGKFYRSGLMTANGLEQAIQKYGIKTVINLMEENMDPKLSRTYFGGGSVLERDVCEKNGAQFVFLLADLTSRREASRSRPKGIDQFLEIVRDPARQPVLLHCKAGLHRTGLLAAVYRMEVDKWSPNRAWQELKANGFGEFACYRDNDYIAQYIFRPEPPQAKKN